MEGMMWFDDTKGMKLEDKISRAVSRYREKHGQVPNLVQVPESELEAEMQIGSIKVVPASNVRPNYMVVGVAGK